jgi:RHS repeat-associated protein
MHRSSWRYWLRNLLGARSSRTAHERSPRLRLCVEPLEDRTLPSTVTWIATGSGSWDVASNWQDATTNQNRLPTSTDDVTINTAAAATITIQAGDNIQVQSVTTASNDTLSISGGSLTVTAGTSALNGPLQVTSGGALTASGAGVSFTANGSTTVSGFRTNLDANGGATLSLPQLTSFVANGNTFTADGSNSVLDLSALTGVQGGWLINATNGGEIKLTGVSSLNTNVTITDTGHSTFLDSNLTNLDGDIVYLDGTDMQAANSWTTFTNGTLNVDGGSYTLPGLTDMDSSQLFVQGGSLSLPGLSSYTSNGGSFQASGAGSVLDVSALTTVTEQSTWGVTAVSGGVVKLTGLTSLNGPFLVVLTDTGNSTLLDSNLTTFNHVWAYIDGTDAHVADSWTTLTNGALNVSGGSSNLPGLTDVDGSTLAVTGGSLALPGLTSTHNVSFNLQGAGSTMLLSALASITGTTNINVGGGAVLSFPVLTAGNLTLSNGQSVTIQGTIVSVPAPGAAGAVINVPPSQGLTITMEDNGSLSGATFNVGTGSNLELGPVVTPSATFTSTGGGTVGLNAGFAVGLGGLTLDGNFDLGGNVSLAVGDLTNLGTVNVTAGVFFSNDGTFFNFGTFIQSGTGNLSLHGDNVTATTLINELGASYLIESDSGIDNPFAGKTALINAGTIRKTAGTGTSTLLINGALTNTGTVEADSGILTLAPNSISEVTGSSLTRGSWNALNGAALNFPAGTNITTNAGKITLGGSGATVSGIANLTSTMGSFALIGGANFTTAGDLNNSGSLTVGAGSTLTVTGNASQTATGKLNIQMGGTPASGQFGQVVAKGTATVAGTFNVALVNGFGPAAGQNFQVLSFASASGTFAAFTGLSPFFTVSQTAASLSLVDSSANAVDLVLSNVTGPTTATAGQSITVNWKVSNPGSQAASGSWQDSVYLSATPTVTAASILLGAAPHTGGLAAGGSYDGSLTAALGPVPPGFYYVLVQADSLYQVPDPSRANNALAASTGQLNVSLPALTLGTALNDSFTAADQDHYYQVTVPAGGALTIALISAAANGAAALYVGQCTLPTPFNFEQAADAGNQPSQTVTVPQVLTAGTYYVLAHSVAGAAATAGYTLIAAQSSALAVSDISSYAGGNAGNVTIEIDGTNFAPAASATLTLGSNTITASAIDFVTSSQIFATFNLSGVAAGSYTLKLQQGANSATAPIRFQVVAVPSPAPLSVVLTTPQFIRSGRTGTIEITYTNPTANDMVAPLLAIDSTNATVFFSTPDDPNDFVQQAQVLAVAPSGPAGILRSGQSGQLSLTILSNDTVSNDTIPVQVSQIAAGQTIDWVSQQATLQPPSIPTAAWNVIFGNVLTAVGGTTDSYNAALAQAATYLGNLGETSAQLSSVGRLWSFLVSQANASFPASSLTSAVDAPLSTPGNLSLAIDRTFLSSIAGRYTPGIFGLGWATSWQMSLTQDAAGNVTFSSAGAFAFFVKQANGNYLDTSGEYGSLTSNGGVFTFTDTAGTQYVFLANGSLNYVQDTNGNRITLGYSSGQLMTLTYNNPANPSEPAEVLTLTYTGGVVTQVADGTGSTWTYSYDPAGQLQSVTAPGNLITSYSYDTGNNPEAVNALVSITYPDGSQRNFTYDAQGRLQSTSRNGGADVIAYAYPGQAEITATDLANHQTIVWFNDLGLPSRVQDPRGAIVNYQYDANGNLTGYTDAAGSAYQYAYDASGNLTQIVNPLGQTVHMAYGPLSNLSAITDAAGNTTQYGHDAPGNLLNITYPGGEQQSFTYDPLGNLSETVLQNGDPISYQSNAQGLVTQETFANDSSQTFAYDPHGNLLTAKTFNTSGTLTGTTTLTCNSANELTSITYPNGQHLDFTYDAAGQRTKSVDQDNFTVNYTYDTLGRLSQLTDNSNNLIVQYTYNNLGQLSRKDNGNGTYSTYAYDAAGNLTSIVNFANATTVNSSFTYTYNLLGEQTSVTDESNNKTSYSYDTTGQLTGIALPGGQTIQYVYNATGDRTEVINNGTPTLYASNADNEITQVGSAIYTYDANGNLHNVTDSSGTTTYTFNDLNQLVSIAAPDGTSTAFQYSPLGFMVGTTANGTQTNFLVDPTGLGNILASYNGSGSLIAHYTYGIGLISQSGPIGTGFYDFDRMGNTNGVTGASGTYVNRYSYQAFGETTTLSAALPNLFTLAGQFGVAQVGSSLYSMRARAYTPTTGQFLSNDPLGLAGGRCNIRSYDGNAPTINVDASGKKDVAFLGVGPDVSIGSVTIPGSHYQFWIQHSDGSYSGYGFGPTEYPIPLLNLVIESLGIVPPTIWDQESGAQQPNQYRAVEQFNNPRALWKAIHDVSARGYYYSGVWGFLPGILPLYNCQTFAQAVRLRYAEIILTHPHDPNALVGPGGFGAQSFLQPSGTWPYTIDFENDGSAAAQTVTVAQQLDTSLDWSTFQLGSFGFGPVNVTVPAGLSQYKTTVSYQNTGDTPLNVLVSVDFNAQTGVVTATFTSLDPRSGQAPTGVFDGFLYPENGTGVGQGYVQYTVGPKAGLTTGTTINQQASVVFDTNAALATDTATNTIDRGAPTSHVDALSANSLPSFQVNWSGKDDAGGSGVASYDIYVSDNGGPWLLWQDHTPATSAVYAGQVGHRYAFYSLAFDNVGNEEAKTPTAEAMTQTPVIQTALSELAGTATPAAEKISALLGTHYSDPDKNSRPGIAVLAVNGNGTWQCSTNGTSWVSITAVSTTSALLLPQADQLRFLPAGLARGTASLLYVAWDGSAGKGGQYVNASTTGGGSSFSADVGELDITLTAVTQAPVWLASTTTLAPELPGATADASGQTVQQTFGTLFSGDNGQGPGVAVVAMTGTANGTWNYNLYDAGTQAYQGWKPLTSVSATAALLLSGKDMLAFVPKNAGFTGRATLQVRAWDQSTGTDGSTVNLSKSTSVGGKTAFSARALTATIHVNSAPAQSPPANGITLPSIAENAASPVLSVTTLLKDAHATDAVKGAALGLAVTAAAGPGTWQYKRAGGPWQAVPASLALPLPPSARVRFVPTPDTIGSATLTWVAWDQTQGAAGASGFAVSTGAAAAFSAASATASLTITAVSHVAPAWNGTGAMLTPVLPGTYSLTGPQPAGDTVQSVFGPYFQDGANSNNPGIAVTGLSGTANGTWQFSIDRGQTWMNFGSVSPKQGRLLTANDRIRFVPKNGFVGIATLSAFAWDGTGGTDGGTTTVHGSAFTRATLTASCLVNTAPTLAP